MIFSVMFSFCYQAPNSLGATVVHLVYTYLTREVEDPAGLNPPERGGPGGAIYPSYLVLHHTAWSAQNGMSTF